MWRLNLVWSAGHSLVRDQRFLFLLDEGNNRKSRFFVDFICARMNFTCTQWVSCVSQPELQWHFTLFQLSHCHAEDKAASPVSPESLYLLPSMVQLLSTLSPPLPPPRWSLFPMALSRYVLKGRADCWRRTVWALAISQHTHTHTKPGTHTHLHRYAHSKLSVLLRCLQRHHPLQHPGGWKVTQGFCCRTTWGFRPPGVFLFVLRWMFEKFTGLIKVTMMSLTEKNAMPLSKFIFISYLLKHTFLSFKVMLQH